MESKGEVKIITKSPVCIRTNLFLNIYHQSISQSIKKKICIYSRQATEQVINPFTPETNEHLISCYIITPDHALRLRE